MSRISNSTSAIARPAAPPAPVAGERSVDGRRLDDLPVDDLPLEDLPLEETVFAKAGRENFAVAPFFLPTRVRSHLLAIYAFARFVDDIGDETSGDVLRRLDWLERELERAATGTATHPILQRLTPTIAAFGLRLEPFRDLIEANRRDQRVTHYQTFDELLGYCALSANPVGRLVLDVLEASTPERIALSDDVCSGLQLVEHWQDIGQDATRGRVYVPADDLARFHCSVDELRAPSASARLKALVRFEVTRARALLDSGNALAASLQGRSRLLISGFAAGGHAALDAIEHAGADVLATQCRPRSSRVLRHLLRISAAGRPARLRRHRTP